MKDFMIPTVLKNYVPELDERLNGRTDCPLTPAEIIHHAYMLTQYQQDDAKVTYNEFAKYVIDEVMEDPTVDQVNQYLDANCYRDDIFYENVPIVFDNMFSGMSVWDVAVKTRGGWYPSAPYFSFDGYDNVRAWEESEIIHMYGRGTKRYLFETSQYDDSIEDIDYCSDVIIEYCNRMLRDGF